MKSVEIELTYLASELPHELKDAKPEKMIDVYIPEDSTLPLLRLRQKGKSYEITKKIPRKEGDYSSHYEHTIPLDLYEFEALRKSSKRSLEKERFSVVIQGYRAEVDVFTGRLAGLVLIDFEFSSEAEKNQFSSPPCCLVDVTQEHFILGGQLAGKSYSDIEKHLSKFNYIRLIK